MRYIYASEGRTCDIGKREPQNESTSPVTANDRFTALSQLIVLTAIKTMKSLYLHEDVRWPLTHDRTAVPKYINGRRVLERSIFNF